MKLPTPTPQRGLRTILRGPIHKGSAPQPANHMTGGVELMVRTTLERQTLQAEVTRACALPRRCEVNHNGRSDIRTYPKAIACYTARDAINDRCYNGGDVNHRQEADRALKRGNVVMNTGLGAAE